MAEAENRNYVNGDRLMTSDSHDSNEPLIEDANAPLNDIQAHHSTLPDYADDDEDETMGGSRWPRCCAISGLVVAIIAAVLAATFPIAYEAILNYELSLQADTLQYHVWSEPPIPLYLRVYLFNVTNPQNVTDQDSKPVLVQMGPYTFTEKHERVHITKFDNNNTLQFQQKRTWHFVEHLSNGTLQDNITALNVPLMGALYTLRYQPTYFKVFFNRIVRMLKSEAFVTKTAGELLFDGYEDPLLDLAQKLPPGVIPPFDKFAWFYQRNNSEFYDGVFNVFTGADDIRQMGKMDMWNSTRQTDYYESHCGMVNGTFGEVFPPHRNRTSISMYVTDICRSISLDYEDETENSGVASYRFAAGQRVFANATDVPDNWCFCSGGNCNPSGIGNSSTCRFGAPAFVSYPHFYLADPWYGHQVDGLDPQKDAHQFHIDLEPNMAVPSKVRARLQVNILVEPDPMMDVMQDTTRRFVPMLWFEVAADIGDDLGWWVNFAVHMPVIGTASFFSLLVVCLIGVAISGTVIVRRRSPRTHVIAPVHDNRHA